MGRDLPGWVRARNQHHHGQRHPGIAITGLLHAAHVDPKSEKKDGDAEGEDIGPEVSRFDRS